MIKQWKYVWVTLAVVSALACIQKESGKFATKAGENDVLFYRKTLTTDNYLRTVTEAASREHKAYNKAKVAYITFKAGGKASISYAGILHKHYAVKIVFKDSTSESFLAYSRDTLTTFKMLPSGENLLLSTHPAKVVTWTKTAKMKSSINEFRAGSLINVPMYDIKYDGTLMITDYRFPVDKTTNLWSPPHK